MAQGQTPGEKPCQHDKHVGTCPCCQRAQLARWQAQLDELTSEGRGAASTGIDAPASSTFDYPGLTTAAGPSL